MSFKEKDAQTTINRSFSPRWYQQEAVDSIFKYFYAGNKGHPLIVVPTGGGKGHILGMFCKRVLDSWPAQKLLILSHVDTILEQDYFALREHLPSTQVGLYSASFNSRQRKAVTVAGIQSVHRKTKLFRGTTLILIDEAHMVPKSGEGQYRSFLGAFDVPVVGLTATHFRLGTGYLHEGQGRLFTDIAYSVDIVRLIDEGFLCKLIPKAPIEHIDTNGLHTAGGDFVKRELSERVNTRQDLTRRIIAELTKYKHAYKQWLVFCIDIEHCAFVAECLETASISTTVVHSKQTKVENTKAKHEFKKHTVQALVSVETLTTGFDVPSIDLIALLRPTQSPVLHIQMIGRGLRSAENKPHCLVLDFAGNVKRLGPINDVQIRRQKKSGGAPITKICPKCFTIVSGSVRLCSTCGFIFTFKDKLNYAAANNEIITKKKKDRTPLDPVLHGVDHVAYSSHHIARRNETVLQVAYRCGTRTFFDFVSFDQNRAQSILHRCTVWWRFRSIRPMDAVPLTIDIALRRAHTELRAPKTLLLQENGKSAKILKYHF